MPVCYGGEFGPDLADVAAFGGVLDRGRHRAHMRADYRVYMVGFIPGFAYLAEVDPAHRRAAASVAAHGGAGGFGGDRGGQTGIYPSATPAAGTSSAARPLQPYDPARPSPFLFQAGRPRALQPDRRADAFERSARMTALHGDPTGNADHRAGPRPVGLPGPRRARGGADGRRIRTGSPTGWSGTTSRPPPGDHADRPRARRRRASVSVRSPARVRRVVGGRRASNADEAFRVARRRHAAVRRAGVAGARSTLAFRGGSTSPPVFGSRATSLISRMGPFGGRALSRRRRAPDRTARRDGSRAAARSASASA